MVQGSLKKKAGTGPKRYATFLLYKSFFIANNSEGILLWEPRALGPKPGPRQIAPKKQSLIKQQKMTKKLTAGLISKTERNLAQKAGHLELLAGGKKDKKKENGNKGGK
ncbi:hypothetical protein AARAC_002566 [Aspergillus arachidicola]|uniref:Uncharacterized protein n=1 Tax=Aspergillus arachidicola TaxID=656916 RepID=A0A2G7GA01_9EURO|nr:hypothetical protein AARAC_002566 [Aspergillus arachidicola]